MTKKPMNKNTSKNLQACHIHIYSRTKFEKARIFSYSPTDQGRLSKTLKRELSKGDCDDQCE